ncbi:hypothetical protein KXW98_004750 [Aspergillus fumigatus]|jgi:hypothetical protein|uniref:Uncharacterized protein n=3 Tax=Aspergillus fumigatus TaxID=746128 RepID=Q4X052_ASPFU|nr:conserved hypothetical protein [Aspergillus fumigatus Af293]EDP54972.1 conserved hypothetical protein [Aspergillus fumigatus A1163]KAF4261540.1 hypothetical protein CNMCM8714_000547 [Aspergillus fumigatus]KMK61559.1 hypothetical protein Y699_02400 [Aspergillus fumigatus Z5]EAL93763.1 conserved hypothetical protein [Aspergillus fumigatus Af293]KAF4275563.1 hypothetical protein CNMCM8812_000725 [Aspergillus fumigatus]
MKNSEILVHISAPSGVRDDVRYRAQVEAILGFQSLSRQLITLSSDERRGNHGALATGQSTSTDPPVDADLGGESKCIQPILSNSQSTIPDEDVEVGRFNAARPNPGHEGLLNATAGSTTLMVKDSMILPDSKVDNSHHISPVSLLSQPQNERAAKDSLESPLSVIPDSQPEAIRSQAEGIMLRPDPCVALGSPPTKRHCSGLSSMLREAVPASDALILAPKLNEEHHRSCELADPHPVTQITPQPDPERPPQVSLDGLPLAIKPSPPPVSREQFVTHVTPTLAMLTRRLKPSRTYKPVKQTRDLEQLERGHWYLRINILQLERDRSLGAPGQQESEARNWDLACFSRFWSFLSDFIAKDGRAGWGVWCILEDATENLCSDSTDGQIMPQRTTAPIISDGKTNPHSFVRPVILKLYAWGEIALHMYLLLFLASERKIRKMGAQWRDGRDEVVIQMP